MKRERRFREIGFRLLFGLVSAAGAVYQSGCTTVTPVVVARSVAVTGPVHRTPIRVTDGDIRGKFRFTPYVEVMPKRNVNGVTQLNVDYDSKKYGNYDSTNNVFWNLPSYVAGLSFDYGLSKIVSFSAGGLYSKVNGKESLEWDAGLAFCFQGRDIGGRFEVGVQGQDIGYDAFFDRYNLESSQSAGRNNVVYLYSFERYGKILTGNFYCNFTLNTKIPRSPVNGFVRGGYGVTSILSNETLRPNEDGDVATSIGFVSISPGIFFNLTEWNRLLLGCDLISPIGMNPSSPRWLAAPILQVDFTI